jgi:hypothetical protein
MNYRPSPRKDMRNMPAIFESTFFQADANHVPNTNTNRDDP